jgi:hypothetical protein
MTALQRAETGVGAVAVMSEAEKAFRAWTRERDAKIAPLLRLIENESQRIREIDAERQRLSTDIEARIKQLVELGVSPEQIEAFVGAVEPAVYVHRVARPRKAAVSSADAASATGSVLPAAVTGT